MKSIKLWNASQDYPGSVNVAFDMKKLQHTSKAYTCLAVLFRNSCTTQKRSYAVRFSSTTTASPHNDLSSYLKYLKHNPTIVANNSSHFKGLLYEYSVQHVLQKLTGSPFTRCGRAGDNGVDLVGNWRLPVPGKTKECHSYDVLVQCKATRSKLSARLFRELEGAYTYYSFNNSPQAQSAEGTEGTVAKSGVIMVMAAPTPITKNGISQFESSQTPIIYCQIDRIDPTFDKESSNFFLEGYLDAHGKDLGNNLIRGMISNGSATRLLQQYRMSVAKVHSTAAEAPEWIKVWHEPTKFIEQNINDS